MELAKPPAENPDGSRTEPSGRGYFGGALNGADVAVKGPKRFAATHGRWHYVSRSFRSTQHFEQRDK